MREVDARRGRLARIGQVISYSTGVHVEALRLRGVAPLDAGRIDAEHLFLERRAKFEGEQTEELAGVLIAERAAEEAAVAQLSSVRDGVAMMDWLGMPDTRVTWRYLAYNAAGAGLLVAPAVIGRPLDDIVRDRPSDTWARYRVARLEVQVNQVQDMAIADDNSLAANFGKAELLAAARPHVHRFEDTRGSEPGIGVALAMSELQHSREFQETWPFGGLGLVPGNDIERMTLDACTDPEGKRVDPATFRELL